MNKWGYIKQKDIMIGDLVKVSTGEVIPTDLVILKSSEADLSCQIETLNLDGESNLKNKFGYFYN